VKQRPLILLGAGGRLGRAIAAAARKAGRPLVPVHRTELTAKSLDHLASLGSEGGDVIFACGITDPGASEAELARANVEVPISVIEAALGDHRYRFVTIGSVLETFTDLASGNRYLTSKAALWSHVRILASDQRLFGRIAHLRGHTFYGAEPAPHSFLGQIHASLRDQKPFRMSEGRQLREYAHFDDVACSLQSLLVREWAPLAAFDLSTGVPVRLGELAQTVFRTFGCEHLLEIGALPTPAGENEDLRFPRSPEWLIGGWRPQVDGIIGWLGSLLGMPPRCHVPGP
jgi:nucleoside-diphosphate-sugar epimerase